MQSAVQRIKEKAGIKAAVIACEGAYTCKPLFYAGLLNRRTLVFYLLLKLADQSNSKRTFSVRILYNFT